MGLVYFSDYDLWSLLAEFVLNGIGTESVLFIEEPLVKVDDEFFVLTGLLNWEIEEELLKLWVPHDGLLVFVQVFDELAEKSFLIDLLIVNFDSFPPGKSNTQWIEEGLFMEVHFMLGYSWRAIVVIHVRGVDIDNKGADEFLISWELSNTGPVLWRKDGTTLLCLRTGTGFDKVL